MRDICPTGWIQIVKSSKTQYITTNKKTTSQHEIVTTYDQIIPLNEKETLVPHNIMSMDIEASSSHGDFPVPIKSYKKLATNIVDHFAKIEEVNVVNCKIIYFILLGEYPTSLCIFFSICIIGVSN